ncbi:MAG: beta strand repeat-containing protein [Candidatus Limnocylindrus sp.]
MTNKRVQFRRGTTAEHSTFTGAAGEVTVDTTNASLRVHNGSTAGGIEAARADLTNISSSGGAINVQSRKITGLGTPTVDSDAVTKAYADSLASGGSLDNLTDVSISEPASGEVMVYGGEEWVNVALSGDVTMDGSGATSIAENAVTATEIAADAVTTAKIQDSAVTNSKLANSSITIGGLAVSLGGEVNLQGTANEISVARVASTFTFGLPNNVTLGGTLTVGGNLVVSGTTTTVNTAELMIEDNVITLNSTQTGEPSNTLTSGIEIERGDLANVSLLWDEGSDKWTVTENGANHYNLLHAGMSSVVNGTLIANGAVSASKIASKTITAAEIADGVVSSTLIANGAVSASKIASKTITAAEIADGIVSSTLIADNAVIAAKVASGAISPEKTSFIESAGIAYTAGNLLVANGSKFKSVAVSGDVTASSLGAFSIGSMKIVTGMLDDAAVTNSKLGLNAVQAGNISNDAVGTSAIADDAVTNAKLANDSISFASALSNLSVALGGTLGFAGSSDVSVSISGSTFNFSLAPTLSVKAGSLANFTADDLAEGETNVYFTEARVLEALHGSADQIAISAAGTFSLAPDISGIDTVSANTFTGALVGNADTATTATSLATAVSLSISGGIITAPTVSFTGGGAYVLAATIADGAIPLAKLASSSIALHDATSNVNVALGEQVYFAGTANEVDVSLSGSTFTFGLPSSVSATTFNGALVGNASTATALETSQVINLGGNLSGSVSFNGTSAVTLTATIVGGGAIGFGTDASASTISLGGQVYFVGTENEVDVSLSGSTFTFGLPSSLSANTFSGHIAATSLKIDGSSVTASAAEINLLDGASSSNSTASKVAVLDGNKDLILRGGGLRVTDDSDATIFSVTRDGATTSVQTSNLTVEDSLVTLNDSFAASRDIGVVGRITSSTFAAFAYDRSASTWKVANVAAPTDNVITFPASVSDLAPLQAGAVNVASLTVGALAYPSVDGTAGQALTTDGEGNISFSSLSATRPVVQVEDSIVALTLTAHASGQTNLFLTGNGSGTVTLPAISAAGQGYVVYIRAAIDGGTGSVEVVPQGADDFIPKNNAPTPPAGPTLFDSQAIRLISGAAAWYEI